MAAPVLFRAQPYDHTVRPLENLAYLGDLQPLSLGIGLVDADGVDPHYR